MDRLPYVLYGRVSSDDQRERVTIQTQLAEVGQWAESHGIEIIGSYLDDGISGTIFFHLRPGGARLIEDAREGRLKGARGVVFLNHKRLGRTALVIHQAIDDIERRFGLDLIATREPVPTEASAGARAMMRAIYAGVAQYDREDILANSKAGMERAARAGAWLGGQPPFGYKTVPFTSVEPPYVGKRLGVDEEQAEVVREIFRLYLSGKRLIAITNHLNARAVPHPLDWHKGQSRPWYTATVRHVLKNTTYLGSWVWRNRAGRRGQRRTGAQGEGIACAVPRLVSDEDFYAVERLLAQNRVLSLRNCKHFYLVRNLIACGACERNFLGYPSKSQSRVYFYYKCASQIGHQPRKAPCETASVRADFVDAVVWRYCEDFIRAPGEAVREMREALLAARQVRPDRRGERKRLASALERLARERERAVRLAVRGALEEEEAARQLSRLRDEAAAVERELAEITGGEQAAHLESERLASLEALLAGLGDALEDLTDERRRKIVLALVERVTVIHDPQQPKHPKIRVEFLFRPGYFADYEEGASSVTPPSVKTKSSGERVGCGRRSTSSRVSVPPTTVRVVSTGGA